MDRIQIEVTCYSALFFLSFLVCKCKTMKLKENFGRQRTFPSYSKCRWCTGSWNLKRTWRQCISIANFKLGIVPSWCTLEQDWRLDSTHHRIVIFCERYQISKIWNSGQRTSDHEFECHTGEKQCERELETILRHCVINGEGQEGETGQQELKGNVCLRIWVLVSTSQGH